MSSLFFPDNRNDAELSMEMVLKADEEDDKEGKSPGLGRGKRVKRKKAVESDEEDEKPVKCTAGTQVNLLFYSSQF